MRVFHFSETTKEFTKEEDAFESPLQPGVFALPRNATFLPVPATISGSVAVWGDEGWAIVADNRGTTVFDEAELFASTIQDLGPIPAGKTTLAPPSEMYSWVAGNWEFDGEKARTRIRAERDARLIVCDWTQLIDVPMDPVKRAEWASYRQLLRDFLKTCDPRNPIWPTPPL